MKGLCNRFNGSLAIIMVWLALCGTLVCLVGGFWMFCLGAIMITLSCLMIMGIKGPDQSKAKKAWIVTWLGKPTDEVINSVSIFLDWLPVPIIGFIEVDLNLEPNNYKAEKPLKCRGGYLEAEATMGFRANDESGAELFKFISSGGKDNIIKQLNGLLTTWLQAFVQKIAWTDRHNCTHQITADWMEKNALKIGDYMKARLSGEKEQGDEENSPLDDARNLGIKIESFVLFLNPPKEVIAARNEQAVQKAKQKARLANSAGFNKQIVTRARLYGKQLPDNTDQAQIMTENLIEDGKLSGVINPGGITLTQAQQ